MRACERHRVGSLEVVRNEHWADHDIVVNVQGDEPLIPPVIIRQVAELLEKSPWADIATLMTPISSVEEFLDPNVVKVAVTPKGRALYFSRAPIPWIRDGASSSLDSQTRHDRAFRHVGLYAYRVKVLVALAKLPPHTPRAARKARATGAPWRTALKLS